MELLWRGDLPTTGVLARIENSLGFLRGGVKSVSTDGQKSQSLDFFDLEAPLYTI